jgi:excisionase family DNA binding protein
VITLELPETLIEQVALRAVELIREQAPDSEEWMTSDETADYLKCGRGRIHNLVSEGRIPVHREGGRLLFLKSELDAWIKSGRAMAA